MYRIRVGSLICGIVSVFLFSEASRAAAEDLTCDSQNALRSIAPTLYNDDNESIIYNFRIIESYNKKLSEGLEEDFIRLNDYFEVNAPLIFVNDEKPCIGADFSPANDSGTGYVYISRGYLSEIDVTNPEVAKLTLSAIFAHEFSHITYEQTESVSGNELIADFHAGQYIGKMLGAMHVVDLFRAPNRRLRDHCLTPEVAKTIADRFFRIGNFEVGRPGHHGTPLQRENVFIAGVLRSRERREGDWEDSVRCYFDPSDKNSLPPPVERRGEFDPGAVASPIRFRGKWIKAADQSSCEAEEGELEGITITENSFFFNYSYEECLDTRFEELNGKLYISSICLDIETDELTTVTGSVIKLADNELRTIDFGYLDDITLQMCKR